MTRLAALLVLTATLLLPGCSTGPGGDKGMSLPVSAGEIRSKSLNALDSLYAKNPVARELGQKAVGIVVFPDIIQAGILAGASFGNGVLIQDGNATDFYNTSAASYGLQAGAQKVGYALMLMDEEAVASLNRSGGWSLSAAPSLVVVDKGLAASLSTATINKGTFAFFFDQKGLMGGLTLEGAKVTRIFPTRP